MRQHLVLVLQLHAKHRVRQRLNHGRHYFDGIFLPAFARILLFLLWPWSHALLYFTQANSYVKSRCLPDRTSRFFWPRQNPRSIFRHGPSVLEVRRIAAVRRHRGPLIIQHSHARAACVDHRLDRQHHPLLQLWALSRRTVIRQLRVFVHLRADPVAHELAHHRISILFHPLLHRGRYVSQAISRPDLRDALLQRFTRHAQQLLAFRRHFAHRHRQRRVAKIPAQLHSEIHRENVALAQFPRRRWNPVHHFLIDRSAHRARIPTVALERRSRTMLLRVPLGELIQLFRRDP